jgi:hypothetical protein
MYRIANRSSMHHVVVRLSAMILVAALSLFAATVGSAAGSSGTVGKAAKRSARHKAKRPALAGVMFGGVTAAGEPVVIQVSRDGREIVKAAIALHQQCQSSGATVFVPDDYVHVPISATGAFQTGGEWGFPLTEPPVTGVTDTGHLSGQFNRAMTSVTGTWSLLAVFNNATGATVDRCDSGAVGFTAIQ